MVSANKANHFSALRGTATAQQPLTKALCNKEVTITFVFDRISLRLLQLGKVYVGGNRPGSGLKYDLILQEKNWLERVTSSPEVSKVPNIYLKRKYRGIKLVFTKKKEDEYYFTLVYWLFPITANSKSSFKAPVSLLDKFILKANDYKFA